MPLITEKERLANEYRKVKYELAKLGSVVTCRGHATQKQLGNWRKKGFLDFFQALNTWSKGVEDYYDRLHRRQ